MTEPASLTTGPERRALPGGDHADAEIGVPPIIAARRRTWRWVWLAVGGVFGVVFVLLFLFNPARHSFYPFCAFHRMTGLQCPGCGGLRAVHHLLHGEVWTAFRFNPLVVLAVPFAVWFLAWHWRRGPQSESVSHRRQARWGWVAFVVLMVFWIVRNLPLEMFRLPAG